MKARIVNFALWVLYVGSATGFALQGIVLAALVLYVAGYVFLKLTGIVH